MLIMLNLFIITIDSEDYFVEVSGDRGLSSTTV